MYCPECGKKLKEEDVVCPKCERRVFIYDENVIWKKWCLGILSFLIPIFGFLLYFVYKNIDPKLSKICGVSGVLAYLLNLIYLMFV